MKRIISAGAVAMLAIGQSVAEILYAGVNSGTSIVVDSFCHIITNDHDTAGGEFAQQNLPGAFGIDYQFINETAIDFFLGAGLNTIRLPFLLVRHS
jgi:endoglucanase